MHKPLQQDIASEVSCKHCGDICENRNFNIDGNFFCCSGCQIVYEILKENDLSDYYKIQTAPGKSQRSNSDGSYEFLDDPEIIEKLLTFNEGSVARITLSLPQIHCSACIWLLENLFRLDPAIQNVNIQFSARTAHITFHRDQISLRALVELLDRIGYPPRLTLDNLQDVEKNQDKSLYFKLGLAGFSFGNIMLLSFPEYLGFDKASYLFHIGYINILLATPVFFYAGAEYLLSAWKGLRSKILNIDLPIAIGMTTLYSKSIYDIISHSGEGYLDSFAGFVFFLLIGKWFQRFTYRSLDFNRNYEAYFPIAATVKTNEGWLSKSIEKILPGDHILIRNNELVPVDGILKNGRARIDYSFVTGEADLMSKEKGEVIHAGGRHVGESIEVTATSKVDQSYLTQLWNEDIFKREQESSSSRLIGLITKYFSLVIITIAIVSFTWWSFFDTGQAMEVFTSILIVACPCALALAIPFTYGNILRLVSRKGFYLRNIQTIEALQDIDTIIFDKTGTLTDHRKLIIHYDGIDLSDENWTFVKSACFHSSHPLSKAIFEYLEDIPIMEIDEYQDYIGEGFQARWQQNMIRLGSSSFIFGHKAIRKESGVFVEINNKYVGYFKFEHAFRDQIAHLLETLSGKFQLGLLSGDTSEDAPRIKAIMPNHSDHILFNQSPRDKLDYIRQLQSDGHQVMMIGDGLNDAGALKQSDVGIVVSDEVNNFSPACDAILSAVELPKLANYLSYFQYARHVIYGAFALAFIYNSVGLYFAISGQLSPVIAAILMPTSSITVILYGVGLSILGLSKTERHLRK